MRTSELKGTIKIGDKSIPATGTIEYTSVGSTTQLSEAFRKLREPQAVTLSGKLDIDSWVLFNNFPFSLFSDEILACFEYGNGISYARWTRSKRAYWIALYRLRGKCYPRERKINQKRLAIVRRKLGIL